MKRQAILIESSQIVGQPDLPGAKVDVDNWSAFLQSDEGGAWRGDEIAIFRKPSWTALQARLALEATTDYVFVTFSGHGYHIRFFRHFRGIFDGWDTMAGCKTPSCIRRFSG